MKKIISFIKKNTFFVGIFSSIMLIVIGLVTYQLIDTQKQNTPIIDPGTTTPPANNNKTAEITSFEGRYDTKNLQTILSWSYEANDTPVKRIQLFHNDDEIVDDLRTSSYSMSQSLYLFPTGDNTFTLKLILENGKEIKKSTNVFISYILTASQEEKLEGNTATLSLTYTYQKDHPVDIPSIYTPGVENGMYTLEIGGTKYKEEGIYVHATTTYRLVWHDHMKIPSPILVRWMFVNININYEYQTYFNKK